MKKLNFLKIFLLYILTIPNISIASRCPNPNDIETFLGCMPEKGLSKFIATAFAWTSTVIGSIAVLGLIYAGYLYITSAGNPDSISKAKDTIKTSLISLLLVVFSYSLLKLLGVV